MQELVGAPLLDHVAEEGRKKQPESCESKGGADPVKITVEVPFLFNVAGISGGLGCILTLILAVYLKQLPLWPLKNISQYAAKYPGVSMGFCSLPTWPLDSHLIPSSDLAVPVLLRPLRVLYSCDWLLWIHQANRP